MAFSENDRDDIRLRRYQRHTARPVGSSKDKDNDSDKFSTSISWPIVVALVPTLGAFFAGNADIWSDFILVLLILYYVYKWLTVPWAYYESARSRRIFHQNASQLDDKKRLAEHERRQAMAQELRRHELVGLIWVVISPAVAGYTLQYSRYFLNNYERYMSSFNVVVFVLAASVKPLAHVVTLLRERTLHLQSELQVTDGQLQHLQDKLELMEDELQTLRKAFATKKDLGQVTNELNPTLQHLIKAIKRLEKKESTLRQWSEDRFVSIDKKVQEFDRFICYRIEQDQRQDHGLIVTMILLPLNMTIWFAHRMSWLLPIPRALLGSSKSSPGHGKHLTHPDMVHRPSSFCDRTTPDPISLTSRSTPSSVAAFGTSSKF
ncbi:hypothetical protein EC973_008755 [Apophysomyces ossiformis]|uniref:Uncharacterized protein n=1 Tax=Apophysomyces ossiformis TaxID=679940 RepID=A0A8H7BPZ7_9FUNG|nr:hypothetical protein EC973_008755 [Apophysomyces ossiformis]